MHACLQRAGDLMYVPALWWHMTLNIGEAAGFSFQRYHLNTQDVYQNLQSGTAHMFVYTFLYCPVDFPYLLNDSLCTIGVLRSNGKWKANIMMQFVFQLVIYGILNFC